MATWTTNKSKIDEELAKGGYASAEDWYKQNNWKYSKTNGMSDQAYAKLVSQNNAKNQTTQTTPSYTTSTNVNDIYNALKTQLQTDVGQAPTYQSDWTSKVNELSNAYTNMTYDTYKNSDAYKNLATSYMNQGQNAMRDTLAQASAQTGGLASSYATIAGQNAYNDYLGLLEEAARSAYNNERTDAYNNLNVALTNETNDYNRYRDSYNDWSNNQNNLLSMLGTALSQATTNDSTAYERALNNAQATGDYSSMGNYMTYGQINNANSQLNKQSALEKASITGIYDDLANYGWTSSEIASAESQWKKSNTSKSGTSVDTSLGSTYEDLWRDAYNSGNPSNYVKTNYKKYGFEKQPNMSDYTKWASTSNLDKWETQIETSLNSAKQHGGTYGNNTQTAKKSIIASINTAYSKGELSDPQVDYLMDKYNLD